jgi:hypothetical protein
MKTASVQLKNGQLGVAASGNITRIVQAIGMNVVRCVTGL